MEKTHFKKILTPESLSYAAKQQVFYCWVNSNLLSIISIKNICQIKLFVWYHRYYKEIQFDAFSVKRSNLLEKVHVCELEGWAGIIQ